jgi:sugar O-acyltransferase (sialic acid O-acetyltransferase NeuD family)
MLIAGAKRHAKEVLDIFVKDQLYNNLCFFDDISKDEECLLYSKYLIIKSLEETKKYFTNTNPDFILGLGNPKLREKLAKKLINQNGILTSIISKSSLIGTFDVKLGIGLNIMHNVMISNSVTIDKGALINAYVSIHHDTKIGKYSEISPHAVLLGCSQVGDFSIIGSNATVLPNVKIGNNVIVGAGAVVNKDLPDNCIAVGIPAKIIKQN